MVVVKIEALPPIHCRGRVILGASLAAMLWEWHGEELQNTDLR